MSPVRFSMSGAVQVAEWKPTCVKRRERLADRMIRLHGDWETMKRLRSENSSVRWDAFEPDTPLEVRAYEVEVAKHFASEDRLDSDPPPPPEGLKPVLAACIETCIRTESDFPPSLDVREFPNPRPFFFQNAFGSRFWHCFSTNTNHKLNSRHFKWLVRMSTDAAKRELKESLRTGYLGTLGYDVGRVIGDMHRDLFPGRQTRFFFFNPSLNRTRYVRETEYEIQWRQWFSQGNPFTPSTLSALKKRFEKAERGGREFLSLLEWMDAEGIQYREALGVNPRTVTALSRLVEVWGRERWRALLEKCRAASSEQQSIVEGGNVNSAPAFEHIDRAASELRILLSSEAFQEALRTLHLILQNVIAHPLEPKYRRISLANQRFHSTVGRHPSALKLLASAGFLIDSSPHASCPQGRGGEETRQCDQQEEEKKRGSLYLPPSVPSQRVRDVLNRLPPSPPPSKYRP